jgi:hypothetical protein
MIGEKVSGRRRFSQALVTAVSSGVGWILIPYAISTFISSSGVLAAAGGVTSSVLFSPGYVVAFGTTITGLFVIGAFTEGSALSVPFLTGANLASAYFIYVASGGGVMNLAYAGQQISLSFQPILLLAMLPSLFRAARVPIKFLLEDSEAARAAEENL